MIIALGALLLCGVFIVDDINTSSLCLIAGIACIYFGLGM
jgi:hypothetical protein